MRTLKLGLILFVLAIPALANAQDATTCPQGQRLQSVGGETRCLPDTTGGKFATHPPTKAGAPQEPAGRQVAPGVRVTTAEEELGRKCSDIQLDDQGEFFCADETQESTPAPTTAETANQNEFKANTHPEPCKPGETSFDEVVDGKTVKSCYMGTLQQETGTTVKAPKAKIPTTDLKAEYEKMVDDMVFESTKPGQLNDEILAETRLRMKKYRDRELLQRYEHDYCSKGVFGWGKSDNYNAIACQVVREKLSSFDFKLKEANTQVKLRQLIQLSGCGPETVVGNVPADNYFTAGNITSVVNNYDERFDVWIENPDGTKVIEGLCMGATFVLPMYMDLLDRSYTKTFHFTAYARMPGGQVVHQVMNPQTIYESRGYIGGRTNQRVTQTDKPWVISFPEIDAYLLRLRQNQRDRQQNGGRGGGAGSGGGASNCSQNPFENNFCGPR